jgi:hypothetical protein
LLQNVNGFSYRGLRTVNTYSFVDASAYVELVQAPASNTNADARLTVGSDTNNSYRMYVSGGNLIGVIRTAAGRGAVEATLFTISYNSTNHRFLRIRNDSGNVTLDTATGSSGVPGSWTQQYSETWNSSISTSSIIFELKAGTSQSETNAPGTITFDNFYAAAPGSPTPTPTPTPTPVPNAPSNLNGTAVSTTQANLSWTDNSGNEQGFSIERCTGNGCSNFAQIATVGANVTNFANTGLTANNRYRYRVRAFNASGNSAYSNIVTVKTPNR